MGWSGVATLGVISCPKTLATGLLSWHKANYRVYPFRGETDPYKILVAEMLLRQTRASQVSEVYKRFIKEYPRIGNLARAKPGKLKRLIEPLGLRSRVRNLLETAKSIESQYFGKIPDDSRVLMTFPGVGRYIANSVLVRAYGARLPLVDSNVNRVLARVFRASNRMTNREAENLFMTVSDCADPDPINYATIDLAHSVCTWKNPRCSVCPIGTSCAYASEVRNRESFTRQERRIRTKKGS